MGVLAVFAVVAFVIVAITIVSPILRNARRQEIMRQPFPPEYEKILASKVSIYRHLTPVLQDTLKQLINVFLAEKHFEGCDGIEITDEIRVTIAAEACLLMLNGEPHFYPSLSSILVYPHPYVADTVEAIGQTHVETTEMRAGESWVRGSVILAWDLVEKEAGGQGDGRGVTLHEFAHQLDQEDGRADGVPVLRRLSRYESWAMVFGDEYQKLKEVIANGRDDILDEYGATNPAEFFAVATETFFRNPVGMQRRHQELYDQLKEYYRADPAEWISKDSALRRLGGSDERVVVRPLNRVV